MVLIVGGGVSGLSAARCLGEAGIAYTLIDRNDEAGGAYRRMYQRIELSSPAAYLALPGATPPSAARPLLAAAYADYLTDYGRRNGIEVNRRDVVSVENEDGRFQVMFRGDAHPTVYRAVIACTGAFDNPFVPEISGLTDRGTTGDRDTVLPFAHARDWRGPAAIPGRRVLIVGGGITAVELAEECVREGYRPVVSTRANQLKLFPRHVFGVNPRRIVYPFLPYLRPSVFRRQCDRGWRYRGIDRGFGRFRAEGRLAVRPAVARVDGGRVVFVDGSVASVDSVVFATGYRFDMPFLPPAISRGGLGVPRQQGGQSLDWPGLFFLGVPCTFGGHSQFVHGIAADAPSVAKAVGRHLRGGRCHAADTLEADPPAEPLDGHAWRPGDVR